MIFFRIAFPAAVALFLAGGGAYAASPAVTSLPADQADELQKDYLKRAPPDLSIVYVARLEVASQRVDVSSLRASILARTPSTVKLAISAARFTKDHQAIEFLSLDPKTGIGTRMVVPLDITPPEFTFPLITSGGLQPALIKILSVDHNP